ncbi:putative membrane-associated zinc metalloprotease [Gottschalkia acidurici 9a]|uniref:Zinc metalloprotease n=1 Tax=Gottschalkia acidurici (strain ATCC 7906 / DSM 604 / BCRC 14475 / CIP 104303 / KCTC 5404 / NCIMB 10678 / 9a) TaxID=1128398 RepID=K0B0H3_GOTA9|nr:RIP metalloprotease RseP [Gottschalkia acidurici]AFS78572.1 putative membrane-associated zinc metalloprotease [Gottschalkia acidurici 9a]
MKTAIFTIFVFFIVVLVHEFGHFIVAKLSGVLVHEFAIGMGPKILSFKKGETDYTLRLLPIGGFVKMEGEDEDSDSERGFGKQPIGTRIAIVSAGAIMNFILALVVFFIHAYTIGTPTTTISGVTEGMPAQEAGLKEGDKIININNKEIKSWDNVIEEIDKSGDKNIKITVLRNEKEKTFNIEPVNAEKENRLVIGVERGTERSFTGAVKESVKNFASTIKMMLEFIGRIFQGNINKDEVSGPVGIVYAVGEVSKYGFMYVLLFTGLISINLGLFNLLPIPALDGSRIVFLFIELLRGKPVDPNKEGFIHMIGFILLILLMIVVAYNDIVKFNILNKIAGLFR